MYNLMDTSFLFEGDAHVMNVPFKLDLIMRAQEHTARHVQQQQRSSNLSVPKVCVHSQC